MKVLINNRSRLHNSSQISFFMCFLMCGQEYPSVTVFHEITGLGEKLKTRSKQNDNEFNKNEQEPDNPMGISSDIRRASTSTCFSKHFYKYTFFWKFVHNSGTRWITTCPFLRNNWIFARIRYYHRYYKLILVQAQYTL